MDTSLKSDNNYAQYRNKNRRQNSMGDEFVFVRKIDGISTAPIVPLMAGITNADPEYFTDMVMNGFCERYLTVVEYVVSGSGYITCDGSVKKVSAGDVYVLHPTFTGKYESDKDDPFVKKWCNIGGRILPALMKAYGIGEQANIFKNCPWAEKYMDELHSILSEYDENDSEEDKLRITHIFVDFFSKLAKSKEEKNPTKKESTIELMAKYIEGNIAGTKITVKSLSEMFYVNKRTLTRMFEKHYGMSPIKYITTKKIECAKNLLREGYSVEEVSHMLSFSSAEYFRKVFVSVCGISPQKYKTKMKKKR